MWLNHIDKVRDDPISDIFDDNVAIDTPGQKRTCMVDDVFSPLVFKSCPKGPGRPKSKRVGQPHIPKKTTKKRLVSDAFAEPAVDEEPTQKKKRSCPAGS